MPKFSILAVLFVMLIMENVVVAKKHLRVSDKKGNLKEPKTKGKSKSDKKKARKKEKFSRSGIDVIKARESEDEQSPTLAGPIMDPSPTTPNPGASSHNGAIASVDSNMWGSPNSDFEATNDPDEEISTVTPAPTIYDTNYGFEAANGLEESIIVESVTLTPTTKPSSSLMPSRGPSFVPAQSLVPSATPSTSPSAPSGKPSSAPSQMPSSGSSLIPTQSLVPTNTPSVSPSDPSGSPTVAPSQVPSNGPSLIPTQSLVPTNGSSLIPTQSLVPTNIPSRSPSDPSDNPTSGPSQVPSDLPTLIPTTSPSLSPTGAPSRSPTRGPSTSPSLQPSDTPSQSPSNAPTTASSPSSQPSLVPCEATIWVDKPCYNNGTDTVFVSYNSSCYTRADDWIGLYKDNGNGPKRAGGAGFLEWSYGCGDQSCTTPTSQAVMVNFGLASNFPVGDYRMYLNRENSNLAPPYVIVTNSEPFKVAIDCNA